MVYEITDSNNVSVLFDNWDETLIWSCLQGIMGKIYADNPDRPTAAMAVIGDFTFFAGKPNIELVSYKPDECTQNFMIMVPQDVHWQKTILHFYGSRAKIISRYAIKKEPDIFDIEKLEKAVAALPEQYELSMIDERLYHMCKAEAWSSDLVSQFLTYTDYRRLGLGAVICKDHKIVSGASSYSRYRSGIEIEIDTKKEYRRKGLAYICGAKLILECLKRGLYPSWDAHNKGSVALAEKLGYHYSHSYTAIEIWNA
ncbi:MAG: GNAT family N-acetyltransferase [Lachnospiraceae bacterium]|nr:GNAT family N-acetyltransferase [Lachnospiraceae bacterium]